MPKNCKKYSNEEDLVIIAEVKANPQNLRKAFKAAASKLQDRHSSSIGARWYTTLRKREQTFTLQSEDTSVTNTKNETGVKNRKNALKEYMMVGEAIAAVISREVAELEKFIQPSRLAVLKDASEKLKLMF